MKKILSFIVLGTMALLLVACSTSSNNDPNGVFEDANTTLGFSALSGILALHNGALVDTQSVSMFTPLEASVSEDLMNTNNDPVFSILEEIDGLAPFLDLVSSFMGGENVFDVNVTESSLEDYAYTMVIQVVDINGQPVEYLLHYNETSLEIDEDEDGDEIELEFEGIMVIEGITYLVEGTREIEPGEESLDLIAFLDDENYITIEFENETDALESETEFVYEMFIDNQLVKRIEIEFEQEEDETELELKFIRDGKEIEFEFEVEIDGNRRHVEISFKIVENGVTVEEGDIDHFAYQITFQQLNLQGVNVAYVFHFNETRVGQDIMLEGIMIKGQEHYRLEGELHITSEGFELELLAEHPTQKDTYVEIEQIVSLDEHTLEFSLVKQGDTIQETLLSLEFDDDMVTVSFEIEFETLEISFEIEFRQNQSERLFFIEFDIDNDNDDDDGVIVASTRLNPEDGLLYFRFDIETDEGEFVRYRVIQSSSLTPTHQALMPEKSNPLLST